MFVCDNACMCVDEVLPQTQGPQRFRAKPQHHHAICDLKPANRERHPTDYITRALIAVVTVAKLAELQSRMKTLSALMTSVCWHRLGKQFHSL